VRPHDKRTRGYSPKAFARQQRLQQARVLLEEQARGQSVTSVAFVCGFTDVSHFSREFSKAFGETPSTILARNRHTQSAHQTHRAVKAARRAGSSV
jgi:AraC-like DNA-binding protein